MATLYEKAEEPPVDAAWMLAPAVWRCLGFLCCQRTSLETLGHALYWSDVVQRCKAGLEAAMGALREAVVAASVDAPAAGAAAGGVPPQAGCRPARPAQQPMARMQRWQRAPLRRLRR